MRISTVLLPLLAFTLLPASLALAKEAGKPEAVTDKAANSSQSLKAGFGRPETITGTIVMVRPEERIVVVAVRGLSEPPSTQILVHERTLRNGDAVVREEDTRVSKGPGETDYNFRVSSSTLIKVDGHVIPLGSLAALKDRVATVRFVPKVAGNFALGIEVG